MSKPEKTTKASLEHELKRLTEKHGLELGAARVKLLEEADKTSEARLKLLEQKREFDNKLQSQKTEMQKKIDELEEALRRQVHKYEDENVRRLDMVIEKNGAIAKSLHYEQQLKLQMRQVLECGFRRAQTDPNFAVVRSLINTGQDIQKVDFLALGKEHPEATIFGLVMVAEELGFHLKMDVKLRDAVEKSKPATWNVNWAVDVVSVMAAAMDAEALQPTGVPPKKD